MRSHGGTATDCGAICLSTKRKNVVISNVIGAAAYAGKHLMLKHLLDKLPKEAREVEAMEHQDKHAKVTTPF